MTDISPIYRLPALYDVFDMCRGHGERPVQVRLVLAGKQLYMGGRQCKYPQRRMHGI